MNGVEQILLSHIAQNEPVKSPNVAPIVSVERLNDGVVMKFADGTCVFYSTVLLRDTIPRPELQDETKAAW